MKHLFSLALLSLLGLIPAILSAQTNYSIVSYQEISNGKGDLGSPNKYGDAFGDAVANIGDLDHDGINDLAVGADYDDTSYSNSGIVYILFMNDDKTIKRKTTLYIPGAVRFGLRLAPLGDINGDGNPDVAIGSVAEISFTGAVYICMLDSNGSLKSYNKINKSDIPDLYSSGGFGHNIANIGDFDGDGVTDLLISAPLSYKGMLCVVRLDTSGGVKSYTIIADGKGGIPKDSLKWFGEFGLGATSLGDLNKDGVTDFLVGAAFESTDSLDHTGALYVLFMDSSGTVASYKKLDMHNKTLSKLIGGKSYFGISMDLLKELSSPKGVTVAVGAYNVAGQTNSAGAVCLLGLDSSGEITSSFIIDNTNTDWNAPLSSDDRFGLGVAGMGYDSFENKRVYRIAVGAAFADAGYKDAGAVYIIDLYDSSDTSHVGIHEATQSDPAQIYPNPANSAVMVTVPALGLDQQNYIQVTDMKGRTISVPVTWTSNGASSKTAVDISDLEAGIYIISIPTKTTVYRSRVIKQ